MQMVSVPLVRIEGKDCPPQLSHTMVLSIGKRLLSTDTGMYDAEDGQHFMLRRQIIKADLEALQSLRGDAETWTYEIQREPTGALSEPKV